MRLNPGQIAELAAALRDHSNGDTIRMIASDIGIGLDDAGIDSVQALALRLITASNTHLPPRDDELLAEIRNRGNAALKALVTRLRRPAYWAPPDAAGDMDPHEAIVLGRAAFVNRADLRQKLRDFTAPSAFTPRVLIVRGDEPCGKSYTYEFLLHLVKTQASVRLQWLALKEGYETPRDVVAAVFSLLDFDESRLPKLTDNPQQARIAPLLTAFRGQLAKMTERFWLVIDDLNAPGVTREVRETAFALAAAAEKAKSDHLWVVLLGYNDRLEDPSLRWVAQEDARFPDRECVATHLSCLAAASGKPLTPERAKEIATLLFEKHEPIDKAAMEKLTPEVEAHGAKLFKGEQP